jgi:hypothetical protein
MLQKNTKYKQVCRLQLFGTDNIFNKTQYQYSASGSTVNNSIRMRFDLKGALSDMVLSQNARAIVETACIPSITNMSGRTVIVRLVTSTQDKVFDTKKLINGNPILFCMGASSTVNALNILYNATELFCNINVNSNFLIAGYIDIELECPSQNTTAVDYITNNPLNDLYINLVIIDEDPEITTDTILAPPIDMKHYNVNMPIRMY